jgi:hypothetical protein
MTNIDQPRERNRTARWATRLDPNYAAAYGCDELHAVFFTPNDGTRGRCDVVVQIPETTDYLFAHAMEVARQSRARVVFICDPATQACEVARKAASKPLPRLNGARPSGRVGAPPMSAQLKAGLEYIAEAPPIQPGPDSWDEAVDFLSSFGRAARGS